MINILLEKVDKIQAEQNFLAKFAPGYVEQVLRGYTADYKVAGPRGIKYEDLSLAVYDALKELATGKITPEEAAGQIERVSKETIR